MSEEFKAELITEIQNDPRYSEEDKDRMICNLVSDGKWITMHEHNRLKEDVEWRKKELERAKAEIKRLEIQVKAITAKYNKLAGIDNKKDPGKVIYMNQ